MRAVRYPPLLALPLLWSCSVTSGGSVPNELATMCIGTFSADGSNSAVAVTLAEFVAELNNRGFVGGWTGSSTAGVLTMRKEDQFAGKSTEVAFETEQRPYSGPTTRCRPAIAVLIRAKVDGELLSAFASQDTALTIAEQVLKARPRDPVAPPATAVAPDIIPLPIEPSSATTADPDAAISAEEQDAYGNDEPTAARASEPYDPSNAM